MIRAPKERNHTLYPLTEGVNPWLVATVVSLATFMEVLDTTITNVSLSHIAGSLAASRDESTWVLTSYLVSNGIVLPLSGWMAGIIGRKRFFMLCIAGFTLASFACGAATSLGALICFRLLQGLAGGGLQPMQQAIIVDSFPPEDRGMAFGLTALTMIAAPIIGPTLGGWITDNLNWRWIFYINVPVGAMALFLVGRLLHDPLHARAQGIKKLDTIGLGLVVLGLAALQIVLDKGQQDDWFDSSFITSVALLSATSLTAAVFWVLRQPDPIIDFRLLKLRTFGPACILTFFTGFVLYSSSTLLPLLLQGDFGYNATLAGLVLSPGGLGVVVLMPIAGRLVTKVQPRYLVMLGLCLCAFGMWHTMHFTPQTDYQTFAWMRITQVLGLPFLFIPVSTLAFMKIPQGKSSKASSLYSLSRNLGGSVGIALITSYVSRHNQIHQQNLAAHLIPGSPVYEQSLAIARRAGIAHGLSPLAATHQASGQLYAALLQQASMLSYRDAFVTLTFIMLSGLILAFILPATKPNARSAPAEVH